MAAAGVLATLRVGTHDDGSPDGVRVTKALYQGLVKLPINYINEIRSLATGTATALSTTVATSTDGTPGSYTLTVPAVTGATDSGAWLETTLWGPRIGVRFRRNNSASLPPFTLSVDGVPYPVRQVANRRHAATVVSDGDFESLFLVADDVGQGPHTVRVSVAGDVIGGASRTLVVYGWLVDRQAGYEDKPRGGFTTTTPIVLTAAAATIPFQGPGLVRKLMLHNTDVATRIVTLTIGGAVVKVISIAAATSAEVDFGIPLNTSLLALKWQADAAAVVNGWVLEAL